MQNIVFSYASACADAIQTRLGRQKMLILYQWRRIAGGRTPTQMPPGPQSKIPVVKKGKMTF